MVANNSRVLNSISSAIGLSSLPANGSMTTPVTIPAGFSLVTGGYTFTTGSVNTSWSVASNGPTGTTGWSTTIINTSGATIIGPTLGVTALYT